MAEMARLSCPHCDWASPWLPPLEDGQTPQELYDAYDRHRAVCPAPTDGSGDV